MEKVGLKIGRKTFIISEEDLVLYNGSFAQLVTQLSLYEDFILRPPVLSRKLFNHLKKYRYLYTDDKLEDLCLERYRDVLNARLYAFDIKKMINTRYTRIGMDLVQVVRCKDCKYYATESCPMTEWRFEATATNGFCNYGETR